MHASSRFVCAINRGRDDYQVPLALYEAGLLERFVTDFYAPDHPSRLLPASLRRRRNDDLPAAVTADAPASFAIQSAAQALGLPMRVPFAIADRLLARKAGAIAARSGADLYCYSSYMPSARQIARRARRVMFEYHPLAGFSLDVLRADHARYPQTDYSYQLERRALMRASRDQAWARADAVVCASAMTRRSLEHDGCPPDRITVIPYGVHSMVPPAAPAERTGRAEFLFVGQGMQRKGLHHLIEAWQASGLANARLTLVCYDIDPGIRAMIRHGSIRLLGRQSRAELDALYAQADVFAMPSLVEGFGLVYLEALAQGCHVIGTGNTGLPDLRLPSDAATLVPTGDIVALAAALCRARDDALAGRLNRNVIRAAATAWQWGDFRRAIADHARGILAR